MTDATIAVAVVGAAATIAGSYLAATRSKRKQPEDRESLIVETTERVLNIVRNELEECLKDRSEERAEWAERRSELEAALEARKREIAALKGRMTRMERQLQELGVEPLNGN